MDVHCHVEWVVYFVLFPVEAPSVFGVAKVNNELLGFGRVVFADPTACPAIIGSLEVMGDAVVGAVDVDWVDPWFCAVVGSREFDYKTCKLGLASGDGDLRFGFWCRRGISLIDARNKPQQKTPSQAFLSNIGGRSGNRTHTLLRELDFESGASTNSAIRPIHILYQIIPQISTS